jgi:hypothetical protein
MVRQVGLVKVNLFAQKTYPQGKGGKGKKGVKLTSKILIELLEIYVF